ncbi:MAG TPA: class I SAM-dependent methyltransferase [Mycobacteriales bacterium]|nr:class I SAM-dependent methyltransferase [Mycobacteriales bacterium]
MKDRAQSFGRLAAEYDRVRPGYPPEVVAWMLAKAPGRDVVDVGAGTGKLTRALHDAGFAVTAVEPDAGMRELNPGALAGSGERLPLPDASADAVVYGQSWHWVEPGAALAEARRVLRPDGVLAAAWNYEDPATDWIVEVGVAAGAERSTIPVAASGEVPIPPMPGVDGDETWVHRWHRPLSIDELVLLVQTWSWVSTRPAQEQEQIVEQVRAVVTPRAVDGHLDVPMVTVCRRVTLDRS